MRELSLDEVDLIDGAVSSDAMYGAAIGVSMALVGVMAAPVTAPIALAAFGGSLFCSGFAYWLAT